MAWILVRLTPAERVRIDEYVERRNEHQRDKIGLAEALRHLAMSALKPG
jgi:hypothetical protein